jgi:hypothetical protein
MSRRNAKHFRRQGEITLSPQPTKLYGCSFDLYIELVDAEKVENDFFRKARRAYAFGCAEQRGKAPLTQRARPAALRPG